MMFSESHAAPIPPPLPAPEEILPGKRISKIRWGIHLAIMAALPLIAGFAGPATSKTGPALTHSAKGLLMVCAFELLFFAIPLGLAWLASRASKEDLLLRWRPGYWVLPLGALYSIAIRMSAGIVMAIVIVIAMLSSGASKGDMEKFTEAHRPQVEKLVDLHAMSSSPAYYWLTIILVSFVIGGFREEVWRSSFLAGLRSIWPRLFASRNGGIAGSAVAAVFFGIGHIPQGILAAALISVVGFLLGVIMTLHRSIWPSVIAHGFFDAASLALLPWAMGHLQDLQKMQHLGG